MVYDPQLAPKRLAIKIGEKVYHDKAEPCGMCGRPSRVQMVVEVNGCGLPEVTWCPRCYETYLEERGV